MKENLRSENQEYKIIRLSSIRSKTYKIKRYFFSGYTIKSEILLSILYYYCNFFFFFFFGGGGGII